MYKKIIRLFFVTLFCIQTCSLFSIQAQEVPSFKSSKDFCYAYSLIRIHHIDSKDKEFPIKVLTNILEKEKIDYKVKEFQDIFDQINQIKHEEFSQEKFDKEIETIKEFYQIIHEKKVGINDSEMIRASLEVLNDPYSDLLTIEKINEKHEEERGYTADLGFKILCFGKGPVHVFEVLPDSPAKKAGLRNGDVLKKIGNQRISVREDFEEWNASRDKNESTPIVVCRNGVDISLIVNFGHFHTDLVTSHFFEASQIGYIKVEQFGEGVGQEFTSHFQKLKEKNMKAFILDLKSNIGGSIDNAPSVLKNFFESGVYCTSTSRTVEKTVYEINDGEKFQQPMSILTDQITASTSEIVTNALRHYNQAYLIGIPTCGKGVGQQLLDINESFALKLTTHKALGIGGVDYHKQGLKPDSYQPYFSTSLIYALRKHGAKELKIDIKNFVVTIDGFETPGIVHVFEEKNETYIPVFFASALVGGTITAYDLEKKTYTFSCLDGSSLTLPYMESEKFNSECISLKDFQTHCPNITAYMKDKNHLTLHLKSP